MTQDQWEQIACLTEPGARLLRSVELKGGVSAQVTMLEIEQADGSMKKLVVRQHGAADRTRNQNIARDEYKLLQGLTEAGLPVPQAYAYGDSGGGSAVPYIVTDFVEGQVELAPRDVHDAMHQLANVLTDIHQADWKRRSLVFLPEQTDWCSAKLENRPAEPDESLCESRIREVLESAWPLRQANRDVLLHGDFWPGNVLWSQGRIAAVIDWEDAALGDPLFDLANARLEILWAYGKEAMEEFTQHYISRNPQTDFSGLSHWDLFAALKPASGLSDWGLEPETEQNMRQRHRWFTDQAFARIEAR
ncbi:phosphotransferase family protein [Paenibacillus dendrobii]|uniref:phosphotransferase family protein n=1 Tax=Paenibacillus dendrobii TaxID=2691084 RepID=UPI00311A9319